MMDLDLNPSERFELVLVVRAAERLDGHFFVISTTTEQTIKKCQNRMLLVGT